MDEVEDFETYTGEDLVSSHYDVQMKAFHTKLDAFWTHSMDHREEEKIAPLIQLLKSSSQQLSHTLAKAEARYKDAPAPKALPPQYTKEPDSI